MENNSYNSTLGYKRGVFVLVNKLPSGSDAYLTFKFTDKNTALLAPKSYLAIFNEVQFANWYLGTLKTNTNNISTPDASLIMEILDQQRWNFVRQTVFSSEKVEMAVLNPCDETTTHRCPITFVDFNEYNDFDKLTEVLSQYPNQHIQIQGANPHEAVMFFDPIKFTENKQL